MYKDIKIVLATKHKKEKAIQKPVLSCIKCDYQEFYPRLDKLEYADPQYCPCCNP